MIDVIDLSISTMDLKFLGLQYSSLQQKNWGRCSVYWKKTKFENLIKWQLKDLRKFSAYLGFITSISFGNINTVTKDQSKSKFL